ncbi:GIY-YIG nuclease family protein [Eggerthella timonensis]|uniref:GIY-YIG nuclease family protein n=1 Tax=Eggerthella timonensis TaxID=1871008 RepID=UPI000C77AE05|nr:GIY-YIG nuclease family protein [Eggerthella timonensis]
MESSVAETPSFYLYVLECADGTWYTGYTVDVDERVRAHNAGAGAKYTRSRLPVHLLAQAAFATKHEAMSAEYRFKRLTRRQKERLVRRAAREPFECVLRSIMADDGGSEGR